MIFKVTTITKARGTKRIVGSVINFLSLTDAENYVEKFTKKNQFANTECAVYLKECDVDRVLSKKNIA